MRHLTALLVSFLLFWAVSFSSSSASPTDKAAQAMEKGDFATAVDELHPLAEKGDPNAEFLLGMLYDAGNGVARDPSAAASWYRRAADQNHLLAQVYLGALFYTGQGVRQDYAEAMHWFQVPAESGNDQAQFYLGSMYATGSGVEKDESKAIQWLTKSATQRNTRAMGMLAVALFSRARDDQDLVEAYAWSHLAAELDPVQAVTSARGVIDQYCNDQQRERGKKAISDWKRKWSNEVR
jgi:TPR repeat protein